MIRNMPGPLTACSLPSRSTTARSHWLAICSDSGVSSASRPNAAAGT